MSPNIQWIVRNVTVHISADLDNSLGTFDIKYLKLCNPLAVCSIEHLQSSKKRKKSAFHGHAFSCSKKGFENLLYDMSRLYLNLENDEIRFRQKTVFIKTVCYTG